jgi:hypothetical protein
MAARLTARIVDLKVIRKANVTMSSLRNGAQDDTGLCNVLNNIANGNSERSAWFAIQAKHNQQRTPVNPKRMQMASYSSSINE